MRKYIEENIIPRYDAFDAAHRRDHVIYVIEQSLELARHYDVDEDMVFAIAAYHDTGLEIDRKTHHLESGRIVRSDLNLRRWFSEEQIEGTSDKLSGKSIVISGVFAKHSRDEYKALIEAHGGKNVGSVSKKTSFILAGENMGPEKRKKAEDLGIRLMTEDEFLELVNGNL